MLILCVLATDNVIWSLGHVCDSVANIPS